MTVLGEETPAQVSARREQLHAEVDALRHRFVEHPQRYVYVLMVVTLIDGSDRFLISTVFEDIKRAFDVSDAQLGLLTAAYSLVATLSIIPFGFLTDRMNRVRLIALGFVPWSIAQIWSGVAGSFMMLFFARLFLGAIEATNGPSTPSLIGDYYRLDRRSRAFGILGLGNVLAATFGVVAGGIVASAMGWRQTFIVWGILGFVTGAAVVKLLPEPVRGVADALHHAERRLAALDGHDAATPAVARDDIDEVAGIDYRRLSPAAAAREVICIKTLWFVVLGTTVSMFFLSALIWLPTFYRRYHGMNAAEAGSITGMVSLFAAASIVVGSRYGDRFVRTGRGHYRMVASAVAQFASMVLYIGAFVVDATALSVLFLIGAALVFPFPSAMLQAALIDIVVPHLRGRASAAMAVFRVIGTAAAPLLFGLLSDDMGLRSAWLTVVPVLGIAGAIQLIAVRTFGPDLRRAQSEAVRQAKLELLEEALDPGMPDSGSVNSAQTGGVVLERNPSRRNSFPIDGYDHLRVDQVVPLLRQLRKDEIALVLEREQAEKDRRTVLRRLQELDALTAGAPAHAVVGEWIARRR